MDKEQIDKILAGELGKIGAFGGLVGGSAIGMAGAVGGAIGGATGASWTSKLLPDDVGNYSIEANVGPQEALKTVVEVLSGFTGKITAEGNNKAPGVAVVMGSGFLGMNPAVVTVNIGAYSSQKTRLVITGTAKEGLIKQHAGEKAAQQIRDLLTAKFK